MKFRKLRIAWSLVSLIACALLIALWVRSYSWDDSLYIPPFDQASFSLQSSCGHVFLKVDDVPTEADLHWSLETSEADDVHSSEKVNNGVKAGFAILDLRPFGWIALCPHWFLVTLCFAFGAAPWLRWRFTLRTLLIATTLVAVVLGLIVYASRH
jgi:hypothetical protein